MTKAVIHGKRKGAQRKYAWGIGKGQRTLNIATVNPDALNEEAENDIIAEMGRRQIQIAGIQETHVTRDTDRRVAGYRITTAAAGKEIYRDKQTVNKIGGAAVIIEPELADMAQSIKRLGNRIATVTLDAPGNPTPVTITTAYAPHRGRSDQIKMQFWKQLQKRLANLKDWHLQILAIGASGQVARGIATPQQKCAK